MRVLMFFLTLLFAATAFGQEKVTAASNGCEGKPRPQTKLTPKQTRDAIIDRTELPIPPAAHIQGCVVLDVFISENGQVECITPIVGMPILLDSVIPEVENWKFKAVGKRRDGTLQLCWHNGWEVGNEFAK